MNPIIQSSKKSHILYEGDLLGHVAESFFDADHWREVNGLDVTAPAGRGTTFFIQDGERRYVLRHYLRGGLPARLCRDIYLWKGLERTRPFREWRLLAELYRRGLPVPRPVAAQVVRYGAFYRGDLVTERVDAEPLSVRLQKAPLSDDGWRAVGQCLRRFHDLGVYHADLNAHNILMNAQGAVTLIDFDRGRLRPPGPWRKDNLARLRRSLDKLSRTRAGFQFAPTRWAVLMEGYARASTCEGAGGHSRSRASR